MIKCRTMSGNADVVSKCIGFLRSMSALSQPGDIGFDTAEGVAPLDLIEFARAKAVGPVNRTPVSLTVVQGDVPGFDLRGTHAVATLQAKRAFGVVPLILISVLALVVALILSRR